jgi:alkanesulfonate monooxygenase SsuD/methylene tetrahydromethanopterin reductase-like flavin-dependent oxidoreductase (luciferase family)
MTRIQFGFCMPADTLDKQRRATFSEDLNRALDVVTGHFDCASTQAEAEAIAGDLFAGNDSDNFDFVGAPQQIVEQMRPFIDMGVDYFILDCGGFPKLTMDPHVLPQPSNHQVVMNRFIAACQTDARIVAAFLGGSYASGTADTYSDLDLA